MGNKTNTHWTVVDNKKTRASYDIAAYIEIIYFFWDKSMGFGWWDPFWKYNF